MELAAIILSVIALISSLACLVIMLAKNFFSTHQIQLQPVNFGPEGEPSQIGKPFVDQFREFDAPLLAEELEALAKRKK